MDNHTTHDVGQEAGKTTGNCPECQTGDLVTITMTVAGRDLAFTTCHFCEAKWWQRDGESVELGSVLDLVALKDQ